MLVAECIAVRVRGLVGGRMGFIEGDPTAGAVGIAAAGAFVQDHFSSYGSSLDGARGRISIAGAGIGARVPAGPPYIAPVGALAVPAVAGFAANVVCACNPRGQGTGSAGIGFGPVVIGHCAHFHAIAGRVLGLDQPGVCHRQHDRRCHGLSVIRLHLGLLLVCMQSH